jgi:hypothetical protein
VSDQAEGMRARLAGLPDEPVKPTLWIAPGVLLDAAGTVHLYPRNACEVFGWPEDEEHIARAQRMLEEELRSVVRELGGSLITGDAQDEAE